MLIAIILLIAIINTGRLVAVALREPALLAVRDAELAPRVPRVLHGATITLYYNIGYSITLYDIILYHIISYHILYDLILCYIVLYHTILCYMMLHIML